MNIDIHEPTIAQYSINLKVQVRDFVGNHGGHNLGEWSINVNDPLEFCTVLWTKSIEHIHRGVIFSHNNGVLDCEWMPDTTPTIDYIDSFLAIYDVAQKKKVACRTIDGPKLHSFLSRDLKLYIYKYSNISSKKDFDLVKAKLLTPPRTDRSGAASISVMNQVTERLKELHRHRFEASSDMCWGIWANDIIRQPAHLHESYMEGGPPTSMTHLFRPIPTRAEVRLDNIHISSLANVDMMTTLKQQLSLSKISLENAIVSFSAASKALADAQSRQEFMENTLSIYESQFRATAMQTELPRETEGSMEMYNSVINQEDYEHMGDIGPNNDET
jgi:hypothetical protein